MEFNIPDGKTEGSGLNIFVGENGTGKTATLELNAFLQFNEKEILQVSGKISHEVAVALAESEYGKYLVIRDRILESDFDREVKKLLNSKK